MGGRVRRGVSAAGIITILAGAAQAFYLDPEPVPTRRHWRVAGWGGVGFPMLGDVRSDVNRSTNLMARNFQTMYGGTVNTAEAPPARGVTYGVEAGYQVHQSGGFGLRFAQTGPDELAASFAGRGTMGAVTVQEDSSVSVSTTFTPLMAGGWVETGKPGSLQFRCSVFAGAAIGTGELNVRRAFTVPSMPALNTTSAATVPFGGETFSLEVALMAGYDLRAAVHLFLEAGYLMATIPRMEATSDVDLDGDGIADIRKGDPYVDLAFTTIPFTDLPYNTLNFDLSGLRARLGMRVGF